MNNADWSFATHTAHQTYLDLFHIIDGLNINQIPEFVFKVFFEEQTRNIVDLLDYHKIDTSKIVSMQKQNYVFKEEFDMIIDRDFGNFIKIYKENSEIKQRVNIAFLNKNLIWGRVDEEDKEIDYFDLYNNMIGLDGCRYLLLWYLVTVIKSVINESIGYIYIIKNNDQYKIGKTINFINRYKTYQRTENPYPYETVFCERVFDYSNLEKQLHSNFMDKNTRGEWFALSDSDLDQVKVIINANKIEI